MGKRSESSLLNCSWLKAAFVKVTGSGQCSLEATICYKQGEVSEGAAKGVILEYTYVDIRVESSHE